MTWTGYIVIALALLAAAGGMLWYRRRTRRTLETMNRMLEAAIRGDFSEEMFDESLLSSLETRLARYLSASAISARNLEEEKARIQALVSDISHQTKTPIANILLYTQLLEEQDLPEEGRACVHALDAQTRKLRSLLEALVKTSRLESGILALHPVPGPLEPMLRKAVSQLLPGAEAKGLTLRAEPTRAEALFDPKWTEEAVFNLLDNAVKYTPEGGQIRLRVVEYPMFAAIQVSDTGPGIPEPEQAKIFQRFYRGQAQQAQEGVGIGLYLTCQIARNQGGYVKVRSRPGEGSVFSLYLPQICQNC